MSYANAIREIPPGSTWNDGEGRLAVVRQAAAGFVSFILRGRVKPLVDLVETEREADFQRRFRPLYDRAKVRSQFSMSCANLGEFRVYWLPAHRTIMCRSISIRRRFTVPEDAVLVGVYCAPCPAADFLEDLDNVIAKGTAA